MKIKMWFNLRIVKFPGSCIYISRFWGIQTGNSRMEKTIWEVQHTKYNLKNHYHRSKTRFKGSVRIVEILTGGQGGQLGGFRNYGSHNGEPVVESPTIRSLLIGDKNYEFVQKSYANIKSDIDIAYKAHHTVEICLQFKEIRMSNRIIWRLT